MSEFSPQDSLDFWFPEDGQWENMEKCLAFGQWRMGGGAGAKVCTRFAGLANAAAAPELLHIRNLIAVDQAMPVRSGIAQFGQHPNRSGVSGQVPADAEAAYIAKGDFPHQRRFPGTKEGAIEMLRKSGLL
jgi:hypothetical protein